MHLAYVLCTIPPLHSGCDILPLFHGNKWGTKLPSCHLVEKMHSEIRLKLQAIKKPLQSRTNKS